MSRFRRSAVIVTSVIVAMLAVQWGAASPALAHNALSSSSPADGARLDRPPASVRLTFLSRITAGSTKILVTGPDGGSAVAGAPVFAGSKVTVPFRARGAGAYLIAYRVASADGHPVEGAVRFTLTGGAGSGPSVTASAAPGAGSTAQPSPTRTLGGTAVPAPATSRTADGGDPPMWPLVLGGGLVLAGLIGLLVVRRRRAVG